MAVSHVVWDDPRSIVGRIRQFAERSRPLSVCGVLAAFVEKIASGIRIICGKDLIPVCRRLTAAISLMVAKSCRTAIGPNADSPRRMNDDKCSS